MEAEAVVAAEVVVHHHHLTHQVQLLHHQMVLLEEAVMQVILVKRTRRNGRLHRARRMMNYRARRTTNSQQLSKASLLHQLLIMRSLIVLWQPLNSSQDTLSKLLQGALQWELDLLWEGHCLVQMEYRSGGFYLEVRLCLRHSKYIKATDFIEICKVITPQQNK